MAVVLRRVFSDIFAIRFKGPSVYVVHLEVVAANLTVEALF